MSGTERRIFLRHKDLVHVEHIKLMIMEGKSYQQMADILGVHKRTICDKIQRWTKTEDFKDWLSLAWVEKYVKVDDEVAFDALTRLMEKHVVAKQEIVAKIDQTVNSLEIDWSSLSEEEKNAFRLVAGIRRAHRAEERLSMLH